MNSIARTLFLLWSATACTVMAEGSDGDGPLRRIMQGQVRGKMATSAAGKPFEAYLGIPFGKVSKRYTSPEPAGPWIGIYDGTKAAPACKQYDMFYRMAIIGEEDCLTINVYTPKRSNSSELLPVMVFIYGGGFIEGDNMYRYNPKQLMNYPIVLAVMNYRVAGFGFLSTGDEVSPGNYGLLDQVLALQWIQGNIDVFGGDPQKVTIFGESAGGASVTFLLLSPLSKGLFRGAISQSGSALCPWAIQKNPLNITKSVAEKVNCTTSSNTEMVECLRNANADDLLRAENETTKVPFFYSYSFGPVVEDANKGGKFLTEEPLKLMKEGRFNKVPFIAGEDSYECASQLQDLDKQGMLPTPKHITDKNLDTVITNLVTEHQTGKKTDPKAIKETYFKDLNFNKIADLKLKELDLVSDIMFRSCIDKSVKLLSLGGIPVYMYVFDYAPEEHASTHYSGKSDASHDLEIYFLFNTTVTGFEKNTAAELTTLRNRVTDMWTNFAIYGHPTPSGPVLWTPTPPGAIRYLNITRNMEMVDGYHTKEMQFWDDQLYNPKD